MHYLIKILYVHHAAGWGGAPLNMINIINTLDRSKYEPFVLLLKDSEVKDKLKEYNIPFKIAESKFYKSFYSYFNFTIPGEIKWYQLYSLIRKSFSWILSRFYFSKKELDKINFDIIHLNSSVLTDFLAIGHLKGKVIIHIQEPVSKGLLGIRYSFFKNQIRKYADSIICISEDNKDRLGLLNKSIVVYNFISMIDCEPPMESYHSKKVLYMGGASQIKGFETIVNALSFINSDITVLFAGYYPKFNNLSIIKRIKRLRYSAIKFKKQINRMRNNEKAKELGLVFDISSTIDEVCCILSPFSVVHFSRPIIEAFARKKTVIATNIPGMSEVVDDKKNGFLIKKDNAKELAQAINFICNNPTLAYEMGNNGYQKAISLFSSKNASIITQIYDKLYQLK